MIECASGHMVQYSSDDEGQWGLCSPSFPRQAHPQAVNVDFSPESQSVSGTWHEWFGKWFWSYCQQLSCWFGALQSVAVAQINIDVWQHRA